MTNKKKFCVRIERVMAEMSKSTDGKRICDWARENIVDFKEDPYLEAPVETKAAYLVGKGVVLFVPDIPDDFLAIAIAHEARHAWQDQNGLMNGHESLADDAYVYKMRILEADAHREAAMFAYKHAQDTDDEQYIDIMLKGQISSYFALNAITLGAIQGLGRGQGQSEVEMQSALFDVFFSADSLAHKVYSINLRQEAKLRPERRDRTNEVCVKTLSKVGDIGVNGENYITDRADSSDKPLDGPKYTRGLDMLNGKDLNPIGSLLQRYQKKLSASAAALKR